MEKKFDDKEYAIAGGADVDFANPKEVSEYYDIAVAGWKMNCYELNNGDCCLLLSQFLKTQQISNIKADPESAFKVANDACARLSHGSCCTEVSDHYLFNDKTAPNYFDNKVDPLYWLECRRRACLEQTEASTGGPRPSDLKNKKSAGESCWSLFNFLNHFREVEDSAEVSINLKKSDLKTAVGNAILNTNNPIKPDVQKIKFMLEDLPLGSVLEQACLFKEQNGCHKLFEAKLYGKYGLKVDKPGAVEAAEEACRRNHKRACYNVMKIFKQGLFVPPDPEKAEYYRRFYENASKHHR